MQYWLMKSEPDECSIDDALAAPGRLTPWPGVRNYQARNIMGDSMRVGDGVLFYHSSCEEPGTRMAQVASAARTDPRSSTQEAYYDPNPGAMPRAGAGGCASAEKDALIPIR